MKLNIKYQNHQKTIELQIWKLEKHVSELKKDVTARSKE